MKKNSIKIGTQLIIGFSVVLFFVVVLGVVSFIQTSQLFQQAETLIEHPFYIREAADTMVNDIQTSRVAIRDMVLTDDGNKQAEAEQLIELSFADVLTQFDVIYERYLGPTSDVDAAYEAFINWRTATEDRINKVGAGEVEGVIDSLGDQGYVGAYRVQMMNRLETIKNFAKNKTAELYSDYTALNRSLNTQRIILISAILMLTIIISSVLIRRIRKPLFEINNDIQRFHQGELDARCLYNLNNEFGMLSESFNKMAESMQIKSILNEKGANLAGVMLSEDDAKKFFRSTLQALADHTGSQMAAVYLLDKDKKSFVHFDSIGLDGQARRSFDADDLEGEFGKAISSRKRQYIEHIPADTRFVFLTAGGQFVPREIITIPILAGKEIIAIISLACLAKFGDHSIELIDSIINTMSARIEGILAYRTVKEFMEILERQNRELDAQKNELIAQAAELTQQNTELDLQKNQLAEASQLKTSFLSNMSHELRTPLNSIIALSGVLNRKLVKKLPEEEYSYLEVIERNGKNLLALINDILDISRIEAGREEITVTNFDVNQMIAEIITMIEPQARQKNIKLIQQKNDADIQVISDAGKCHHILQNLIGNAVKFTEKGNVKVSAQKKQNQIEIKVTDTGIGIAKEHLLHIFDEFRQGDGGTSRRYGGSGLGLAIAKKYANLLGGTITVNSVPGEGSEFTALLPSHYDAEIGDATTEIAVDDIRYSHINPSDVPISNASEKTILLVDDSEPAIIQIKYLMEESGYKILIAHNADEAFKIIEKTVPDAMILDLMMPDVDGFKTLITLRAAEPTAYTPILILTAKHITHDELRTLKRNRIYQIIQKGDVDRAELLKAVDNMLYPKVIKREVRHKEWQDIKGKPVLLVVEDNTDNMITVKALLEDKFHLIEAKDGEEGVELAKKYLPNLILMDIALPGISGVEAFKAVRNDPKSQHIPIVALTASAMIQERETILSHGFDAYVAKPIDVDELLKVIGEVLYGK